MYARNTAFVATGIPAGTDRHAAAAGMGIAAGSMWWTNQFRQGRVALTGGPVPMAALVESFGLGAVGGCL